MKKKNDKIETGPIDHGRFHKKPRTRRDFLAQGYISAAGSVMAPSLLSMVSQRAMGADCSTPQSAEGAVPFLVLDLAGGHNIAGSNVIVGKQGGQQDFLASYESIGLTNALSPANAGNITALNGNVNDSLLFHSQSSFYAGLVGVTSDTTRANMDGVLFCTASVDDTNANPHNPTYWINKAGLEGALVPLVGTRNSDSGARAAAPAGSINPANRPVQISNPNATGNLVDLGLLASLLSTEKAEKVMRAVSSMSATQLTKFNEKQLPQKLKDLVECGYINSAALISQYGPAALDPRQDASITTAFGNFNGNNAKSASVTKLVLDGLAGAGSVELGGYDYHGNGLATQATKDQEAGRQAGQMFEAAALKGVPLVLYWFTDGGVSSRAQNAAGGKFAFTSDSGQRSSAVIMIFDPKGKPKIRNGNRQVGAFNDSGAVNNNLTVISSSVETLGKLVVANYLALSGREGDLAKVVGDNPFGSDLDKMLSFSKDTLNK